MSEIDHGMRRINLVQGEFRVSDDPSVVFTTILGSCVGACIRDPIRGVGGMNHFLLPGAESGADARDSERLGVHLMELLVNGLMRQGAQRDRLEAKVFGGARMMRGLSDIGKRNTEFALQFLKYEGIRLVGGDSGGEQGRRLQFWPVSGRARQSYISSGVESANKASASRKPVAPVEKLFAGEIDLF
jgi:chemotaxis protein CheD